ncbi:MAG: pseudaminic acid synthase [Nitrospirae bacterium]|nr:pseudaminic acid synthase [Nitrospirota bacterium]
MKNLTIGNKRIGLNQEPFIIAEMSGNHNKSLDRALAIVDAVFHSGSHALKLQTYTADTITIDIAEGDFYISDSNSLWKGNSLYNLYKQAYTPWEWHKPILDRCRELGLICFSTPFDETAVDFLEELNVPAYKIASFENNHLPLIRKVAYTGKPLIISTGMANIAELHEAVECAREAGCKDIILLKCTSAYPAMPENSNILTIPHIREMFKCEVGLSDHTMGVGVAVASVALGATVIEKHFTLSRTDGGVDSAFSIEPDEMKIFVQETSRAWKSLGTISYELSADEKISIKFRRSLYVVKDIKAGDKLTHENLRAIRPGYGMQPKHFEQLLGKTVNRDIRRGTALKWELIG